MDKWMNAGSDAGSDAGSEQTDWLPTMSLGLFALIILIVLFIIYGIPYIRKLIALSRTQPLYNSLKKTVDTVLTQEQNSVTQRQSALFGTAAAQSNPDTYIGCNNICTKSGQQNACEKICKVVDESIAKLIDAIKQEIAKGLLALFTTIGKWKEWGSLKEGVQSLDAGTISLINLAMCKMIDLLSTNTSTSCGQAELAEQNKLSTLIQDLESLMVKIEKIPFGDIFKKAIKKSMGQLIPTVRNKINTIIANHISTFMLYLKTNHLGIYLAVMSILTKACSGDACGSDTKCTAAVTNAIKAIRSVGNIKLEDINNGPKVALYLLNKLIPKTLSVATVAKVVRYVCNATSTYRTNNPSSSITWKVADQKYTYDPDDPKCLDPGSQGSQGSQGSPGCCSLSDYQDFVSNGALRKVTLCKSKND